MQDHHIEQLYQARRARYAERDNRMRRVREVLKGELNASMRRIGIKDAEPVVGNLILSTVRTISQRVGKKPRLYAASDFDSDTAKKRAERHEQVISQKLKKMAFWDLLPQAAYWLSSSGFQPFLLTYDPRIRQSRIRIRDPLTCYPATVWPHEPGVKDCLFVYRMTTAEVIQAFPEASMVNEIPYDETCTIGEFINDEGTYLYVVDPQTVFLGFIPNQYGKCPVWIARDIAPDFDFYGQFDQVVPIMEAEARLTSLLEAYAEQQVTAETWVIGEITSNEGNVAHGLGAVNVLEPAPNASVQKLTNNASPQVFQELSFFERQQRLTGGIPAQLGGEPEVSYATGRGIEKLTAAVDDNVGHYQNILTICLTGVINAIPEFEAAHGVKNTGLAPDVTVYPHFKVGADPAMDVALLQKVGAKTLSRESAMDQDILVENPQEEEARIQAEALEEALITSIAQAAAQGQADHNALIHLIKARKNGDDLAEALDEYYKQQEAQMPPAGPPGLPPPGGPPGAPSGGPPPDIQSLLMGAQGAPAQAG